MQYETILTFVFYPQPATYALYNNGNTNLVNLQVEKTSVTAL